MRVSPEHLGFNEVDSVLLLVELTFYRVKFKFHNPSNNRIESTLFLIVWQLIGRLAESSQHDGPQRAKPGGDFK
jgi:hypothetical protein